MVVTDPVEMAQAIFGAFPDLTGRPVTVHDGGWDSVGIEIDRTWMFKFPRDADGLEALRLEAAVLDAVRPYVTISVPEMIVVDQPILFTRHRMLPGSALSNADYLRLSEDDRTRLAGAVGGFLAEVHGITADWSQIGVESDDDTPSVSEIADAAMPLLAPKLRVGLSAFSPTLKRSAKTRWASGSATSTRMVATSRSIMRRGALTVSSISATPPSHRGMRSSSSLPMFRATSRCG